MLRFLFACLQLWVAASAIPLDQQPLTNIRIESPLKVQAELKKAEIIPTVIDDFLPSLSLSVSWSKKSTASLGNTLKPKKLQSQPTISLHDDTNPDASAATSNMTYVITLTDPDAPSRADPKWSEMCHWIAANISLSDANVYSILPAPAFQHVENEGNAKIWSAPDDVVEYKPPGPPEKTGKHRYVFLAFAPRNGTSEPLDLKAPEERQHWGTGKERGGVREWAESHGLVPVAANFIYAQHKKQ